MECGLSALQNALAALFNGDAEFVSVRLGAGLLPNQLQLVLASQRAADAVPEHLIQSLGSYLRGARDPDGQGVGLHLAWRVTTAHGFTFTLQTSEYGGLEVVIEGDAPAPSPPGSSA